MQSCSFPLLQSCTLRSYYDNCLLSIVQMLWGSVLVYVRFLFLFLLSCWRYFSISFLHPFSVSGSHAFARSFLCLFLFSHGKYKFKFCIHLQELLLPSVPLTWLIFPSIFSAYSTGHIADFNITLLSPVISEMDFVRNASVSGTFMVSLSVSCVLQRLQCLYLTFLRSKLINNVVWTESGARGVLHCCFSVAAFPSTLRPFIFSSEQCCVQLFGVAVTRSTLPAFLFSVSGSFSFSAQPWLTLLHWLIHFMLWCSLPLINFLLLFHYNLNHESPQPLKTSRISFTSCTGSSLFHFAIL